MKQSRLLCTPQGTLSTMPSYKRGLRLTARSSVGIFLTLAVAPQLMGQARCDPELVRLARGAPSGMGHVRDAAKEFSALRYPPRRSSSHRSRERFRTTTPRRSP